MDGIACPRSPIADRVGPDEAGIVRHFNEVVNALLNRCVVIDRDVGILAADRDIQSLDWRRRGKSPDRTGGRVAGKRVDAVDDLLQQRPLGGVLLNPLRKGTTASEDALGTHALTPR